jgi:hypothetical protein
MSNHGWHLPSDEPTEYERQEQRLQQLRYQIGKAITHLETCNSNEIFGFIKSHMIYPQSIREVSSNFSEYDDAFIFEEIRKQIGAIAEANAMQRSKRGFFGKR